MLFINHLHMGIGGITLSTSLVTLFNATVLGILISKKIKMDYGILFKNLLKMCVAGVITFVICFVSAVAFDKFIELPKYVFEIVKISFIGILCLGIYVWLNIVFKMDYAQELFDRVKAKICK